MYYFKNKIIQCLKLNKLKNYINLGKCQCIKLIQIRHRHKLFNINLT